jgi:hypothetical protein
VNGQWLRAAGAGEHCAPAARIGRFWVAPQLHSKAFPVVSTVEQFWFFADSFEQEGQTASP